MTDGSRTASLGTRDPMRSATAWGSGHCGVAHAKRPGKLGGAICGHKFPTTAFYTESHNTLDSSTPNASTLRMDRTLAHVARLMRSILLQPGVDRTRRPSAQFIAGKHSPFHFPSGIGISWWYSDDTFRAQETLAALLVESDRTFKDCDTESIIDTISSTLQQLCLAAPLFNGDDVFLGRKPNLFECKGAVSVADFASRILAEIKSNLRSIIGRRCTVYPLGRFLGPSFTISEAGLRAISKADASAWKELVDEGYEVDHWSPQIPRLKSSGSGFPHRLDFEYVLVSEDHGTQKGARFASSVKFRTLITILFAVASARSAHHYHKAMAQPYTSCIQFPHASAPDHLITTSDCGALSPFYASDIPLDQASINQLRAWYDQSSACSMDFKQRLDKAAYFVNRGMNADDIEAYVNNFVALDALFGERGAVEASIISGIHSLALGGELEERVSWLFDLRNELVHGGSRYITEWPKYQRYLKHFETKPLTDIGRLARTAILRAPGNFAS